MTEIMILWQSDFGPPCTVFYAVAKRIELEQWDWSHFEALSKGFHYLFLFFIYKLFKLVKLPLKSVPDF